VVSGEWPPVAEHMVVGPDGPQPLGNGAPFAVLLGGPGRAVGRPARTLAPPGTATDHADIRKLLRHDVAEIEDRAAASPLYSGRRRVRAPERWPAG